MKGYLEITVELVVGFFALLVLTKVIGRSSISEATPFDFVAALVLGEFVGGAIYDDNIHLGKILFVIVLWGILIYSIDFLTLKFNRLRGIFESKPSLLINNGVILRSSMKKNKIDVNRLQTLLREKNIFSIREVAFAILEPNGKLSVIKNPLFENVKRMDLDLPIKTAELPLTLISDGVLIKNNLDIIHKDENWLIGELQMRGIPSIREVMLAEYDAVNGLYVQPIYKGDTK
ncbi:DUF421 domain-containing protein [Tuberibacillus calidus]|uniref:DUF421 domain-containing protein n=1 Tax=Tuberibacillus calidus TaxID=340097 RepID=UPI000424839A|nr:DUF421 domain-containing protein [Tuberibacillus calidus]